MKKELETIDIKGKKYVLVQERVKAFRENYAGYSLETEVVEMNDKVCILRAVIRDENGVIKATGLAREVNGSSFINKTSYVENAETSAWGRALGNFGIGIDTSIASADEVANAITGQNSNTPKKEIDEDLQIAIEELSHKIECASSTDSLTALWKANKDLLQELKNYHPVVYSEVEESFKSTRKTLQDLQDSDFAQEKIEEVLDDKVPF